MHKKESIVTGTKGSELGAVKFLRLACAQTGIKTGKKVCVIACVMKRIGINVKELSADDNRVPVFMKRQILQSKIE
jgi:hypothetical protein